MPKPRHAVGLVQDVGRAGQFDRLGARDARRQTVRALGVHQPPIPWSWKPAEKMSVAE
ncbi:hypothetical protein AB0I68_33380 [Streptomyces sp. NPDC050448]|uniref:hypothetical protein n=1 Tax=Streptomyces sp. NPDC050448 TaxID=3155404 RepID=UPI00341C896F